MLELFTKRRRKKILNQIIGGQSVILKLFLGLEKQLKNKELRKIEITYFTLSIFSYIYLRLSNINKKEEELDIIALTTLTKSIEYCDEKISLDKSISEYQIRYKEYSDILLSVFESPEKINHFAVEDLTKKLCENVTDVNSDNNILEIMVVSPLIAQFIVDNIKFIREEIK